MTVVRTGLSTVESARRERVEPTGGITATNAQKALEALDSGKALVTRLINTTAPLSGGGDLSADRTLSIAANGISNALAAQMPANTLKGNNTAGTANSADLTATQAAATIGVWGNNRVAKIANYTVVNADKGQTFALGGAAFFTLTFSAASGYDANFSIAVLNEDSGRAKWISITGGTSFYLWPGQSIIVYNSSNVWQTIGRRRWKLPSGALTINTDFTNGSDANGVSDGLGTGAAAFKTFQYALNTIVNNEFDFDSTLAPTLITIKGTAGVTDTTTVHWSPHGGAPLAQGSAAITIDGNGGTLNCTPSCIELFYGAVVTLKNITLIGASNGIALFRGSKLYLGASVTFGACGNSKIYLEEGAAFDIQNSFSWTGNSAKLIENAGGVIRVPSAVTATLLASVTLTITVYGTSNGVTDLANITWTLGGFTVTAGNAYNISQFHTLTGYATIPGTGPGSVANIIGDASITAGNSLTLNTVSVAKGGTGITSGTSGGLPYFNSTTTVATSAALGAGNVVVGGGAGAAPSTISDGQLPATATNDNASAGKVGEVLSSTVASGAAVALTTATPNNLTSLALTAGDWDVWGHIVFTGGATTTVNSLQAGIGTTTLTLPGTPGEQQTMLPDTGRALFANLNSLVIPVGPFRQSIGTTTTYFAVAQGAFGVSTLSVYGKLQARRRR